ncbi:L-seryl-tRNA(Sec) selenium transferase [Campylobacter concisus]|uniref:L-seryl-tRNA(Sec) selenium transferase n=1 Tax=Campylobacter concisus TaxID=199 RepID=UPI000CD85A00|nr:L-seryl-tRNA(Sec) selenium transferase [Campylobacter concisus]
MSDLRDIPQVDKIIKNEAFSGFDINLVTLLARQILNEVRAKILNENANFALQEIIDLILNEYHKFNESSLQRVLNLTGVTIHTNLARSVIDKEILSRATPVITGYSNLEYDLKTGSRGNRYDYIGEMIARAFGFDDAIVVNNNASAVFLVLNTFAKGREVVVSRGELVEIGGSFRVPEVMANAGCFLKEVGTTNKTKLKDYEEAISENTAMLVKVHRSNFDIVGFSEEVTANELSKLACEQNLIDYFDLGSGFYGNLPFNLDKNEPDLKNLKDVSLVSFSGDKLLGAVQCGIIVGKKELIAKLRKNQILRMLRVDKVIISLLAESMKAYLNKEFELITTQKLLHKSIKELENLANFINKNLKTPLEIVQTSTFVGGGAMPNKKIPSMALAVSGDAVLNEQKFRQKKVIGRIENDKFLLDLRTLLDEDVNELIKIINETEEK